MQNIEQLLNRENWVKYLELATEGGLTDVAVANDIVAHIKEALSIGDVMPRCITCTHFTKTYEPKLCWRDRMVEVKAQYPQMSEQACAALANDYKLWEQKETEKGFCKYHDIQQQIPNHFSCLNHNVAQHPNKRNGDNLL